MNQLHRLGERELICLLLFTCNYVVSVWRGVFFLWVLGMGYVILLWHLLSLPYNYFISLFSLTLKTLSCVACLTLSIIQSPQPRSDDIFKFDWCYAVVYQMPYDLDS